MKSAVAFRFRGADHDSILFIKPNDRHPIMHEKQLLSSLLSLGLIILAAGCEGEAERFEKCPPPSADEPVGLPVTWQWDPTTTMVIDWHVLPPGPVSRIDRQLS